MPTPKLPTAIVIGSGFGGISSAIRLQAAGFNTTLLEKQDMAGGRAYVYHQDGFTFDAGPTVITAPECIDELFAASRRNLTDYITLLPVRPFYRLCWDDGYQFDYDNDSLILESQIKKKNPADVQGYERFLRYSREVFDEGYTKLAHVPFLKIRDMVQVSPQLLRLKSYKSVYSSVSSYISDPHLRQAFSFHSLLIGGNPFSTPSIYTLIHYLERKGGVFFPKGGTGSLVKGLVKLFKDLGGTILLNSEVEQINCIDRQISGVRLTNGKTLKCDIIVSNADVYHTYNHLLKESRFAKSTAKKLGRMTYSMSLFLIYFGTKKQYPELAHHTVIFGPRYKGLLKDIFKKGILPEDFSLYLHAPTRTDPSLAPPGHEGFYVLSPVGHLGKLNIDWEKEAPQYANKIFKYLEEKYLPGLTKNLATMKIFTPMDFKNKLNAHLGSAFSLEPKLTQSAYFRVHNRDKHIQGLYFSGAGTHPGAGVPGVLNSAKATVDLICKDYQ
ncbi:MAG: phytoene desaturase [Bacteriovoracia bacterium]